jgi:hypothetical protein
MKGLVEKRIILSVFMILLSLVSFFNAYYMIVVKDLYPAYLQIIVYVFSLLLFVSGLGLMLNKKWAYYAFIGFSFVFLVLAVVSQLGLLSQNWLLFFLIFMMIGLLLILVSRYIKKCTG